MTLEEVRARNDELRQFRGGRVLMTLNVWSLPARLRGQALWHMSRYDTFSEDCDHSEGVFFHEGHAFHWHVSEFAGDLFVTLDTVQLRKESDDGGGGEAHHHRRQEVRMEGDPENTPRADRSRAQ